jgi:hypothetical protein
MNTNALGLIRLEPEASNADGISFSKLFVRFSPSNGKVIFCFSKASS